MTQVCTAIDLILPHSYPFLLIDKVVKIEKGRWAVCLKNVSINEEFFRGHFQHNPVMPGVLVLEAMAQAAGLSLDLTENAKAFLARIDAAKFRRAVVPGDVLVINAELIHKLDPLYVFDAKVYVNNIVAAEAEITLCVS